MNRHLRTLIGICLLAMLSLGNTEQAGAQGLPVTVDSFDVGANLLQVGIGTTETTTDGVTGLAGGERDIVVEVTEVGAANEFNLDIGNGELAHSQASGVVARSRITYDGDDNIADGVSVTSPGLGSLDLSAGDAMLVKVIEADLNGEITLTVYEDNQTTCSTLSRGILTQISSTAPRSILFDYADFTTGSECSAGVTPDFSDIDAIVVEITGPANFDVTLSKLEVVERMPLDFGDLPADYGITAGDNGASHMIGDLYLGGSVDDEFDGQPSDNANGDDLTGNVDDEDGVRRTAGVTWQNGTDGGSVDVQITGGEGCLMGWIDWRNLNGFSTSSRFGDVIINNEAVSSTGGLAGDGYYTLTFDIPSAIPLPGTFYARFRLFPRDSDGTCSSDRRSAFTGQAANGEVEDYRWQIGSYLIGDTVWLDENQNGVQDNGEHGIGGVLVNRLDPNGDVVESALTDNAGHYSFEVSAGTHSVEIDTTNFQPGGVLEGVTATTDSPIQTNTIVDADILTYDFGYHANGSIGDYVWYDANEDGVQQAHESGIEGVTIELWWDADGSGTVTTSDSLVSTATTDSSGLYLFDELLPRDYVVVIPSTEFGTGNTLSGLNVTNANQGDDALDSDGQVADDGSSYTSVSLGPNATDLTNDFGLVATGGASAQIGNLVWSETVDNGQFDGSIEQGINGIEVSAYYDFNGNGQLDIGSGDIYIGTQTTTTGTLPPSSPFGFQQVDGFYLFGADFGDGQYFVVVEDSNFDPGGALEIYTQSTTTFPAGDGNDEVNRTEPYLATVENNTSDFTADFGFEPPGYDLGDRVWYDLDADGVQDAGEPGIDGVTVELWVDNDNDGEPDGAFAIATDTTDINGDYLFTDVPSGNYVVVIPSSQTASGGALDADTYTASTPFAGTDSTADSNGTTESDGSVTAAASIADSSDLTYDFGFFKGGTICLEGTDDPANVGATIFYYIDTVNGTVTLRTTLALSFADTAYGAPSQVTGWPGNGRKFHQVLTSDNLNLELTNGDGTTVLDFTMDLLMQVGNGNNVSYVTGGIGDVSGKWNDGSISVGSASDVLEVRTSFDENFTNTGWTDTQDSPTVNADYPNPTVSGWIWETWYEATVSLNAFGASGFGEALVTDLHSSPSKTNEEKPTVQPCP